MKKISTSIIAILFAAFSSAQVVTFETLPLDSTQYWKGVLGVAGTNIFQDGGASFTNRNDTSSWGDYWSGWAYSAKQDTTSISYATNDISAITGKGQGNSNVYGVAYLSFNPMLNSIAFPSKVVLVNGFYVTNTTIAYRSMQNGDFAAKKFGGTTGNDPDFFRIDITGSLAGVPKNDTVHFYLADFRDTNNVNDYIVNDWRYVDLTTLGNVDTLSYTLTSSDNSTAGMNTPAYFCMDSMAYSNVSSMNEIAEADGINIYPVPMNEFVNIENTSNRNFTVSILNINGQQIASTSLKQHETKQMNTKNLAHGIYIIRFDDGVHISYKRIIK